MNRTFAIPSIGTKFNSEEKIWSAPRVDPLFNPNISLGQIIVNSLSKAPDNVGQIYHENGHEMFNWEILRNSVRASLNLRDLGLKEGDVLGFAAGNSRHVASLVFGAMLNGIPVGTLDPTFELSDIRHMFGITQPKIVFCDEVNYQDVKSALDELQNPAQIYVFDDADPETVSHEWRSAMQLIAPHSEENSFS